MYRRHENLKFLPSLYGTMSLWFSFFQALSALPGEKQLSGCDSPSALTFCLGTFFSCRPLGTAWWGNPTWSKCLTSGCRGNATEAAHRPCGAVMGCGGLLSTLPSFPFPGLSLTISIPAPQVPSFQSSGLLQRFSPTATIAPNLTFGHLVRTSCQNGKNSTNTTQKT